MNIRDLGRYTLTPRRVNYYLVRMLCIISREIGREDLGTYLSSWPERLMVALPLRVRTSCLPSLTVSGSSFSVYTRGS